MFLLKQLNPICMLVLILTAFYLSNCSESSEFGKASDYEKGGYSPSGSNNSSGSGTIRGTVRYDNNTAAENVSVSFALSGAIVNNDTTDTNGDYSQDNLSIGTYTISFTKNNFIDANLSATLETDNQSVTANMVLLADNCTAGTVAGTITDAVSGSAVSGVSISVRNGWNVTSGSTTGTTTNTATNGTYTLSSMNAGGYTIEASKSGFISAYFNINVCGNMTNQNTNISEELSSGTMRIVLHWAANSGVVILDSHLTGPDNNTGRFHMYYNASAYFITGGSYQDPDNFYYHTNAYQCNSCTTSQASDNVSLDRDDMDGAPGTETITITKVRSGTYRYSVHDYTNRDNSSSTKLAESGTTVNVFYNNTQITYNVPNSAGNLWEVFTFDGSTGALTASDNMTAHSNYDTIQ